MDYHDFEPPFEFVKVGIKMLNAILLSAPDERCHLRLLLTVLLNPDRADF